MTRGLTGTGVLQDKIYNYKLIITNIVRDQVHVCNLNTLENEEGGFKTSFSSMLKKHNTSITLKYHSGSTDVHSVDLSHKNNLNFKIKHNKDTDLIEQKEKMGSK